MSFRRAMGCGVSKGTKVLPAESRPSRRVLHEGDEDETSIAGVNSPTRRLSRRASRRRSSRRDLGDQQDKKETAIELAELRSALQATQAQLQRVCDEGRIDPADPTYLIVRRDGPVEETCRVLTAELVKLQPYGPTDGEGSATNKTIEAQGVMIKRLETDLAAAKDEMRTLKESYERKMRRVRINSAKHRADSELKIGELQEQLAAAPTAQPKITTAVGVVDDGPHTELIISLSEQLASCHEELRQANEELTRLREGGANLTP